MGNIEAPKPDIEEISDREAKMVDQSVELEFQDSGKIIKVMKNTLKALVEPEENRYTAVIS